jgi:hypothetical protein
MHQRVISPILLLPIDPNQLIIGKASAAKLGAQDHQLKLTNSEGMSRQSKNHCTETTLQVGCLLTIC